MRKRIPSAEGLEITVSRAPARDLADGAARLKEAARGLGFGPVGIAPARLEEPTPTRLLDWLARGQHGTMGYMAEAPGDRLDASSALPGAAAVLVVALPYPPNRGVAPPTGRGQVSTYAQAPYDYHRVIAMRLSLLEALFVDLFPEGRARRFCDTTPLLERAFAYLAGIGFVGKNTQVISREVGSFIFLGGLVVDRALPLDVPDALGSCGTCTRCLEACPTDAFSAPYVLDARRCISYLTIEHRGAYDADLRSQVGEHLFGCDVCQAVCPWNAKFAPEGDPQLQPEAARVSPALADLYPTARDRFKSIGRHTPWGRTGKRGFLRNLATTMGNTGGPECEAPLCELSAHEDAAVAEHGAWGLARLRERLGKEDV